MAQGDVRSYECCVGAVTGLLAQCGGHFSFRTLLVHGLWTKNSK